MKKLLSFAAVAAAVFFPAIDLPAAVQPDALFQDHYVFCAGKPTDFTGTAAPGEKITIASDFSLLRLQIMGPLMQIKALQKAGVFNK